MLFAIFAYQFISWSGKILHTWVGKVLSVYWLINWLVERQAAIDCLLHTLCPGTTKPAKRTLWRQKAEMGGWTILLWPTSVDTETDYEIWLSIPVYWMNYTIIEVGNVFFGVTFQVSKDSWQEGRLRKQFLQFRNNEFLGMIVIIMLNHDISGWTRGRQPGPMGMSGQSSRELIQRFCGNRAFSVRGRSFYWTPLIIWIGANGDQLMTGPEYAGVLLCQGPNGCPDDHPSKLYLIPLALV